MAKKIPKQLRKSIMKALVNTSEPLTATNISERLENDPDLPMSMKMPPRKFTFTMKKFAREVGLINQNILSTNGLSRHGTPRVRVGYSLPRTVTLAEAVEAAGVVEKSTTGKRILTIKLDEETARILEATYEGTLQEIVERLCFIELEEADDEEFPTP
jgi:hypothetical protein